jgi:hypoxanthine phosphoribosyltransferase
MKHVQLKDKKFAPYISEEQIQKAVKDMAQKINLDYRGKEVIFLGILNGVFMFAADLMKYIDLDCQISFLKLASYEGTSTSGKVKRLIGVNEDLKGHTVIILEDIVDSGLTLDQIMKQLGGYEPDEIKIATLFFKPKAYKMNIPVDYVGMEIPNAFIVGYGLDYNGFGRNLRSLYKLDEN